MRRRQFDCSIVTIEMTKRSQAKHKQNERNDEADEDSLTINRDASNIEMFVDESAPGASVRIGSVVARQKPCFDSVKFVVRHSRSIVVVVRPPKTFKYLLIFAPKCSSNVCILLTFDETPNATRQCDAVTATTLFAIWH